MYLELILTNFVFILLINICAKAHQNQNFQNVVKNPVHSGQAKAPAPAPDGPPQALWAQYGNHDFMHDIDHLKEEANKLLYMQESEQITIDQSAFYYTKLHDFNSDGRLDGLELLLAVKHSLVHHNNTYESVNLEEMAAYVDSELSLMDLNNDGFVDYGEIYTYMEKNRLQNNPQNPK